MRNILSALSAVLLAATLTLFTLPAEAQTVTSDPENTLLIELKTGVVTIELYPDVAPNHVTRVKELAREGFYDNVPFHRVIEGFMAQTGDGERGNGTGGSSKPDLRSEFSDKPFERGTVGMARSSYEHSANSQFFICFEEARHLNGQYTVVGKVVDGMEHVDQVKRGVGGSGTVLEPRDVMITVRVAADVSG